MFDILRLAKKGDYIYAVVPDHPNKTSKNYVLHHRVVMENYLGRLLTSDEVVHHKDEDKHNNNISNLEVMDKHAHNKLHAKVGRTVTQCVCAYCGVDFVRESRKLVGKAKMICSRSCNAKYNREHSNWGWQKGQKK